MRICAIIPSYNHYKSLEIIVKHLNAANLPIFIIDDGSDEPASSAIAALKSESLRTIVYRFNANRGKGDAVLKGFELALKAGFTHAVQIDADGQHDLGALEKLLALSAQYPDALISGKPMYDASIPLGRKIGRWMTHIWVWLETLSFRIQDSMCGFRVYPLVSVQRIVEFEHLGHRMDFDTEIMVRLFWRGVNVIMLPVNVVYPVGNPSNFRLWRDNWQISRMHARLFLTMLWRMTSLFSKFSSPNHWADLAERGSFWGLKFCAATYCVLGRKGCRILMFPIVLYFYLVGTEQRHASLQFISKVLGRPARFRDGYRHHMNFAMRALDVFGAWAGGLSEKTVVATNPIELEEIINDPRGGVIVVSHLGNVDVSRAALDKKTRERITILVHSKHAENYNKLLKQINPQSAVNVLQVTEIGPETIIGLKQRVENGEWVVIAGDRTSVLSREHSIMVPFFGSVASFPQGPWVLGALLECPVYLLFCMSEKGQYRLTMERFSESIKLPRGLRHEVLRTQVIKYASRLEHFAALYPFQWYNFFDFWADKS